MRILIVGSGGREHALAWKLAQSPRCSALYVAPGNAGTAALGRNVDLEASDVDGLLAFAREHDVDLTVVGPEVPLVAGIVDAFEEAGLPVVGPTAEAAQLEGSKAFAKQFMEERGIPTARHRTFSSEQYEQARSYVDAHDVPVVIKASGLAGGKGALVCQTRQEALDALDQVIRQRAFGGAGDEVVVEEFMEGEEASVFVFTDGTNYVLLPPAQDHKRAGEGDTGPNTGGMGAYAPAPIVTGRLLGRVCRTIIEPTLEGMRERGTPYRGVLYCGLMITEEGPKVVEFNCRLGDPEAQVVLPLLESDLVGVLEGVASGRLENVAVRTRPGAAACVVMASGGYPVEYDKGFPIEGLDALDDMDEALVFHAGTARDEEGRVVTAGGRVLGVTATGRDLAEALEKTYHAVDRIDFEKRQYRNDIGQKGLERSDVT